MSYTFMRDILSESARALGLKLKMWTGDSTEFVAHRLVFQMPFGVLQMAINAIDAWVVNNKGITIMSHHDGSKGQAASLYQRD